MVPGSLGVRPEAGYQGAAREGPFKLMMRCSGDNSHKEKVHLQEVQTGATQVGIFHGRAIASFKNIPNSITK